MKKDQNRYFSIIKLFVEKEFNLYVTFIINMMFHVYEHIFDY